MSIIFFLVRKEIYLRCIKIDERKCIVLFCKYKMNLYLLDKEFIVGRSRF